MVYPTFQPLSLKIEPGRAGNLSPEQEQKLKEMWSQILVFVGAAPKALIPTLSGSSAENKPKKGLFGWGSAKHVDDATTQAAMFQKALSTVSPEDCKRYLRDMSRADNPDNLLLRFMRARKWDCAKALEMFAKTIQWRSEFKVEELLSKSEEQLTADGNPGLVLQPKLAKCVVHGHDLKMRPIVNVRVRLHKPSAQTTDDIEKFTVQTIESSRLCLEDPVDTAAVIFDMSDFTLENMDFPFVRFLIKCFEGHYPESLGFLLIHKAPWVFQGVWATIKGWIDPVVASKITFTRNYKDITQHIAPEHIPKELGGTRDYEYEYISPKEGENDLMKDTATRDKLYAERCAFYDELEELTVQWVRASGEESNAINVKRQEVITKIKSNYWQLDPYVRARTIYDRDGTFGDFKTELQQDQFRDTSYHHRRAEPEKPVVPATGATNATEPIKQVSVVTETEEQPEAVVV